jgi:MFS transporter, ACS family, tartrate transporter
MQRINEQVIMRRVFWNIMPILIIGSAFHNLDKANISFASIKMNVDLGLTATQFGLAAGIYYIGYLLSTVPSNLIGARIGLRLWLPGLMIVWGLISTCTALVTNATELAILRIALGAAEAGFVPGALLLISIWVPESHRGRFVAWFWAAASFGSVAGAPLSAYILGFDSIIGLRSWQVLFMVEAAPICLVGLVGFWFLHTNPADAGWLNEQERAWISQEDRDRLSGDQNSAAAPKITDFLNRDVVILAIAYFLILTMGLSFSFFLAPYLNFRKLDMMTIGSVIAAVHVMGVLGHFLFGRLSDRSGNRHLICFIACLTSAVGLSLFPLHNGLAWAILCACTAQMGLAGAVTSFWPLPMAVVRGGAAAAVLAGVNLFGHMSGLVGPYLTGRLKDITAGYDASLYTLAVSIALAGLLVLGGRLMARRDAAILLSSSVSGDSIRMRSRPRK